MSIIPIETNFTGVQKRLVPKCILIDVYDLEASVIASFSTIKTLHILSGGSIITNIIITTSLPAVPHGAQSYTIKFYSITQKLLETDFVGMLPGVFIWGMTDERNDTVLPGPLIFDVGPGYGSPLSSTSQLYVSLIKLIPKEDDIFLNIPHLQCVIEYLAEES